MSGVNGTELTFYTTTTTSDILLSFVRRKADVTVVNMLLSQPLFSFFVCAAAMKFRMCIFPKTKKLIGLNMKYLPCSVFNGIRVKKKTLFSFEFKFFHNITILVIEFV